MLTAEERQEIEAELPTIPLREAVCIDAMKIVQRHRGWVSDESIRDIGELLEMSAADLDGVATFYNLIFRKPVGRARDHALRQRELLDHGLRPHPRAFDRAPRNPIRGNHRRQSVYSVAHRVSRRVRPRAGHDDRQRSSWEPRSGQRSTGSWRRASRHAYWRSRSPKTSRRMARLSTSRATSMPADIKALRKALRDMTPRKFRRKSRTPACAAAAAPVSPPD